MKQTTNSKGHNYEMPSPIASSLVHRSTWQLFCRSCDRRAYPNVIDLIERHGELTAGYFYDRARCAKCGGRFAVNGMPLHLLIAHGDLHPLRTSDGSSFFTPSFHGSPDV